MLHKGVVSWDLVWGDGPISLLYYNLLDSGRNQPDQPFKKARSVQERLCLVGMGIYLGSFWKRKCITLTGLLFLQVSFASQFECSKTKTEFNLGQVNLVSHFMKFYRFPILKSAKAGRNIL